MPKVADENAELTFDPKPGTTPDLPPAAGLPDRSVAESQPGREIDHVMSMIAMEEHAASDVAVGPHSKALFGVGPGGLDLPPVQSRTIDFREGRHQDRDGVVGQIGARVGPGRAPLPTGGTGDSDLEEWSDDDH